MPPKKMAKDGLNTHSWVEYPADHGFPIQSLPYCSFFAKGGSGPQVGVGIGDFVVNLKALADKGTFFPKHIGEALSQPNLNGLLALAKADWKETRDTLTRLFSKDEGALRDDAALRAAAMHAVSDVTFVMPVQVGDYTDFYSSEEHATNLGKLFRPGGEPLLPNWKHIPVGYHGRASSIVVSGTPVRRPVGQQRPADDKPPVFGASKLLDIELEMGFVVGTGNPLGEPIPISKAEDYIFGYTLFNDWSSRDIQKWEYVPLGPFLGKSFCSTVSPWIIPAAALEPFRCAAPSQDPEVLPYLKEDRSRCTYDIALSVGIKTAKMEEPKVVSRSNFKYLYWSPTQQLTHHACNGCNLRPGDMMASGTISGPTDDSCGSLLELTWRGTKPMSMPTGEERKFLQDGDTIILGGECQGDGFRISFGEAAGTIAPAPAYP